MILEGCLRPRATPRFTESPIMRRARRVVRIVHFHANARRRLARTRYIRYKLPHGPSGAGSRLRLEIMDADRRIAAPRAAGPLRRRYDGSILGAPGLRADRGYSAFVTNCLACISRVFVYRRGNTLNGRSSLVPGTRIRGRFI